MENVNESLAGWIISKIKNEYCDDIKLLVGDDVYKLDIDRPGNAMSYYFPASERANKFARTFIIDGIGYDLFPMSWERIENIANLDEDNAAVLLDSTIIYSASEDEKQRFMSLQSLLRSHLADPRYSHKLALQKIDVAMDLFRTMSFEDTLYKVRKAAGYILIYLSHSVAYANHTYFRRGHNEQVADLAKLPHIPDDFLTLTTAIIASSSIPDIVDLCRRLIKSTRQFFADMESKPKSFYNRNYQDLAGWYHELSYAWREVYHWCERKDAAKAFIRGSFLQSEMDVIQSEFGLPEMDLLGAFDGANLDNFQERARLLETRIIETITKNGAYVDSYDSIEEFLVRNS